MAMEPGIQGRPIINIIKELGIDCDQRGQWEGDGPGLARARQEGERNARWLCLVMSK